MAIEKIGGANKLDTPNVSVLIPAYNVEKYLRRALDSVLNQTYQDFEIILIDDGSTDSTPMICDEYGQKYDFIHVYHQENIGLSKTREKLLEKACGKYIFWLDSDDYYDKTLLGKAVRAFSTKNADIVFWYYAKLVSERDKIITYRTNEMSPVKWRELNVWGMEPVVWMYASRRELWNNLEKFPDDLDLTDDVWLTTQIVPKAENIVSLEEYLYFYDRTNLNSIMNTYTAKNLCRVALAFYIVLKRNLEKGINNGFQPHIRFWRQYLVNTYCINCVNPSLTSYQISLIRNAVRDMFRLFPQRKMKQFYIIQLCVIHGIDSVCRWYGKSRIKRFKREQHN